MQHLRILSGFYGLLRPFGGVMPYRLFRLHKFEKACRNDMEHP